MFKRQMRLKYLPDMKQFQLQLYQLSRLLKDTTPDLYDWLDKNDVPPTLYAAPWILTIFSSQFPLGFVSRIFDLLFLESNETIFRIAVAILTIHKEEILRRENFEEIMNYLKNVVPQMDANTMDCVLKEACTMEISNKLVEYYVEYNVLQEEITSHNHHMENLNRLKESNQHLEQQLEIAQSTITQLDRQRQSQQSQLQAIQSQIQGLEVTVSCLGRFLYNLAELNPELELPGDVRRIVQQINYSEQQQRKKPVFLDRRIGKSVSVNSHLGLALKVLEEETVTGTNDNGNGVSDGTPINNNNKKKSPFFEHTFEQIRQQKQGLRLNRLEGDTSDGRMMAPPELIVSSKLVALEKTPNDNDSGIATPLSPSAVTNISSNSSSNNSNKSETESEPESLQSEQHPLSNCAGDINVRFNGTTQLKSIRSTVVNSKLNIRQISKS